MKKLSVCLLLILTLSVALTSCSVLVDEESELYIGTETFLDCIIEGDADRAYSLISQAATREQFDPVFVQMQEMFQGVESYELKPIGWNINTTNGVTVESAVFRVTSDNEEFTVETAISSEITGLYSLNIVPGEATVKSTGTLSTMKGADTVQWIFIAAALLETAFVIWMLVDCCRHKVNKKPLWIVIIILGMISVALELGGGSVNLKSTVGLIFSYTSFVKYSTGEMYIRVLLPIGAVVYACMRKKLFEAATPEPVAISESVEEDMGAEE